MGPDNPWSPNWRPDPTGGRLIAIRTARRGALLAGILYLPTGAIALVMSPIAMTDEVRLLVLVIGLPAVALLGAGLAPSTIGSRIDAVVAGVAFAIGAPVAAVTSILIGALVVDVFAAPKVDLVGPLLRGGVMAAVGVAPLVALVSAAWVVVTRRLAGRLPDRDDGNPGP
jgi:hypothetical protein